MTSWKRSLIQDKYLIFYKQKFLIFIFFFQDSESLRERMLTIENQLKQLQQSITTTSSISSSTAEQQEVILVREAEPSSQWVFNISKNYFFSPFLSLFANKTHFFFVFWQKIKMQKNGDHISHNDQKFQREQKIRFTYFQM